VEKLFPNDCLRLFCPLRRSPYSSGEVSKKLCWNYLFTSEYIWTYSSRAILTVTRFHVKRHWCRGRRGFHEPYCIAADQENSEDSNKIGHASLVGVN